MDAPYYFPGVGGAGKLHNRHAGIEPIIGHLKHGWQMGKSRMKSDATTLSAGCSSILGFNLRQLKKYFKSNFAAATDYLDRNFTNC